MSNILEYTLSLQDLMSAKLHKIGVNSDSAIKIFSELEKQQLAVKKVMNDMGTSVGTLSEKLRMLRAEKEWIPAKNEKDIRRYNKEIASLEKQITRLNTINGSRIKKWFSDLRTQVPMLNAVTNPIAAIGLGVYQLSGYIRQSADAYKEESVQVTKLHQLMSNTMGATDDQVRSILDLASAQQKLGVIGDEVQISGAQELSTYLTKKESLERLMPVMNDMLAQQYGLNATQEQATTIAQMMGKVMDGQVGALSRYGYSFTEAQEKVLKYGNEQERVAMLSEVISSYVGGVNEALAKTPEGKLKNVANAMGDMQERVGKLYIAIQTTIIPLRQKIADVIEKIIMFFEQNKEKILSIVGAIAGVLGIVFDIIGTTIGVVMNIIGAVVFKFQEFFNAINSGNPLAIMLATGIGVLTTALAINWVLMKKSIIVAKAKFFWDKITVFWNNVQTASWWKLNLAMLNNPIGWIVGLLAALVVGFILAWKKLEWFRGAVLAAWEAIKGFGGMIKDFVIDRIKGLLKGIAGIGGALVKLFKGDFAGAWNQAKEAVGDLIGVDAARNAVNKARETGMKMGEAYRKGVADVQKRKEQAGIAEVSVPGMPGLSPSAGSIIATSTETTKGAEGIASGGTRNTEIHITLGNMVENIIFNGGLKENRRDVERQVEQIMMRTLNMAYATSG